MAEHDVLTFAHMWLNLVGPEHSLKLIRDEDHHNVSPFGGFGRCHDFQAFSFALFAAG